MGAPEDHAMTCEECQTGIMKSQEQLLNPKTIDYLVEQLTPIICASNEDERCPRVVDTVIRQGLSSLLRETSQKFQRFATPLCRELAPRGEDSSQAFQNFEDDISSVPFKVLFNMK